MKYVLLSGLFLGLAASQASGEPLALSDGDLGTVTGGLGDVQVEIGPIDPSVTVNAGATVTNLVNTPVNSSVLVQFANVVSALNEEPAFTAVVQNPLIVQTHGSLQ